jgi:hypothetical protein
MCSYVIGHPKRPWLAPVNDNGAGCAGGSFGFILDENTPTTADVKRVASGLDNVC